MERVNGESSEGADMVGEIFNKLSKGRDFVTPVKSSRVGGSGRKGGGTGGKLIVMGNNVELMNDPIITSESPGMASGGGRRVRSARGSSSSGGGSIGNGGITCRPVPEFKLFGAQAKSAGLGGKKVCALDKADLYTALP
ncbi:hypothetical protein AYI69_g3041 [Smittium culicis]|uniref:Uncharacterized protein n=1 Tax=Smittium culicis TaxID=133412 RepID=A0A1R1YKU3_9FUNG|nr:hypothetical protein AYI69_g3041 [Smittium culicis]